MMDGSHLNQKHMKKSKLFAKVCSQKEFKMYSCVLTAFTIKRISINVHHLHGHMLGDAFCTGQLQCQWCPVENRTIQQLSVPSVHQQCSRTKSKMLIFCIVLILALIFITFDCHSANATKHAFNIRGKISADKRGTIGKFACTWTHGC